MSKELVLEDYIELDEEETREFFNKYDRDELEGFDFIFYYAMSYDLTKTKKILEEVYNEKEYSYKGTEDSSIMDKNKDLSMRELNYLYNLLDDGWMCTVNTREFFDYSDEGKELSRMRDIVYKEMNNRINKNTKKNILTI